jgi:hypothetical protein
MTSLRQRMIEDMKIRNLADNTQASYVQQVAAVPPPPALMPRSIWQDCARSATSISEARYETIRAYGSVCFPQTVDGHAFPHGATHSSRRFAGRWETSPWLMFKLPQFLHL